MDYDDLDDDQQTQIHELLHDGVIGMIHDARKKLAPDWSRARREEVMRQHGKTWWDGDQLAAAIRDVVGLDPDAELMQQLEAMHEQLWVEAASWEDE